MKSTKSLKTLSFFDMKEDSVQNDQNQIKMHFNQKLKISTDNLTQISFQSQCEQDQILSKFKENLPNSLSNLNNLSLQIKQKLQKLLFWQQKQKVLELKLQKIKSEKLMHLENKQQQHKDFIIEIQRKTFQTFTNSSKMVGLQNYHTKTVKQNQNMFESKVSKKTMFSSIKNLHQFQKTYSQKQSLFQSQARVLKTLSDSFDIKYCCISKNNILKKQHNFSHFQFITKKNTKDFNCFGICDSHGEFAKELSTFLAKKIPTILSLKKLSQTQFNHETISQLFDETLINLYQSNINIDKTGASVNFCLIQNNMLHVLNIGDCRCIMGFKNYMNKWVVKSFMKDHTLQNEKQAERIQKLKGLIKRQVINGKQCGPLKIWDCKSENSKPYGINITRSAGDMCLIKYGILNQPQITSSSLDLNVTQGQKIIVIASAELYKRLQNLQIIQFLSQYLQTGRTVKQASLQLIKMAYQKSKLTNKEQQGIVATVIFLS